MSLKFLLKWLNLWRFFFSTGHTSDTTAHQIIILHIKHTDRGLFFLSFFFFNKLGSAHCDTESESLTWDFTGGWLFGDAVESRRESCGAVAVIFRGLAFKECVLERELRCSDAWLRIYCHLWSNSGLCSHPNPSSPPPPSHTRHSHSKKTGAVVRSFFHTLKFCCFVFFF